MADRRKSTRTQAKKKAALRFRDTPETVNPLTLPWNHQDTAPGEQETWEELREDIMDAFDEGELSKEHVHWYLTIMAEMFDGEVMRTPGHVVLARMCFFAQPGVS